MLQLGGDVDWWRGAVIYQVYPRSFQDSTGSGAGDIAGITKRLDHIAGLGADAVWISPFFTSPMKDFGYDVSDYLDVDPMFGTLDDFRALVARAHELGLRVMIDLVLSHTSDQHAWFVESRADKTNDKADWYVWADAKTDGTPPNNWLSIFGGSAWQWDGGRMQYYLHNFLDSQPDLNFHNVAVREAVLNVARFWLDLGVDGFRLDTINFYFCDAELRDNPALPAEKRNASIAPAVNPYNWQEHLFDKNQPENIEFLQDLRWLMDQYPATAAVGEVGDAQISLQIMADYTAGDDRMHMCYAFELLSVEDLDGSQVADTVQQFINAAPDGWPCWALSNHDVMRHASRLNASPQMLRQAIALLVSLRGSICLYQGEEIGMTEGDIPFEALQDPYGIAFWPEFKGRDGCRTPMVWNAQCEHGGFSETKPWLPIDPTHFAGAVDTQSGDAGSLLSFYRDALALRRKYEALRVGDFVVLHATKDILVFERNHNGQKILCSFNFSDEVREVPAQTDCHKVLFGDAELADGAWIVPPTGVLITINDAVQ